MILKAVIIISALAFLVKTDKPRECKVLPVLNDFQLSDVSYFTFTCAYVDDVFLLALNNFSFLCNTSLPVHGLFTVDFSRAIHSAMTHAEET
jgi:hypothetical protein